MTINGVELEIDFTDADVLERIDKECEIIDKKASELRMKKEELSLAEGIRQECEIVKNFFDKVFGEGTSEKLFGKKDSLTECLNAYEDTMNAYQKQYQEYNERINKYSPDRFER